MCTSHYKYGLTTSLKGHAATQMPNLILGSV